MSDQTLSHKGYHGSMAFSVDDECLFGEVLFVNDLILYQGETVSALKAAFIEAVDNYLSTCRAEGITPNKPFGGTFNVRVSPAVHKAASIAAANCGSSLNDFVRTAIEEKVLAASSRTPVARIVADMADRFRGQDRNQHETQYRQGGPVANLMVSEPPVLGSLEDVTSRSKSKGLAGAIGGAGGLH